MAAVAATAAMAALFAAPAACCDHGPGPPCWAHSCRGCCPCPPAAVDWQAYRVLGGLLPQEELSALPPEQRARRVASLNAQRLTEGTRGLRFC